MDLKSHAHCMNCCRNVTRTATSLDHCSLYIELVPGGSNVRGGECINKTWNTYTFFFFFCYAGARNMHTAHSLLISLIRIFPHLFPLPSCLLHLLHLPLFFHLILYSHVSSPFTKLLFLPHFLHLSKHHIRINRHRWRTIRYRVARVQTLLDDT